jgi:hypothetical protein
MFEIRVIDRVTDEEKARGLIDLIKADVFIPNKKGKFKRNFKVTMDYPEDNVASLIIKLEYQPTPQGLAAL